MLHHTATKIQIPDTRLLAESEVCKGNNWIAARRISQQVIDIGLQELIEQNLLLS